MGERLSGIAVLLQRFDGAQKERNDCHPAASSEREYSQTEMMSHKTIFTGSNALIFIHFALFTSPTRDTATQSNAIGHKVFWSQS